jgi:hypothetical protein
VGTEPTLQKSGAKVATRLPQKKVGTAPTLLDAFKKLGGKVARRLPKKRFSDSYYGVLVHSSALHNTLTIN